MNIEIIRYKITGETSLLMDSPASMFAKAGGGSATKVVKTDNPQLEAESRLYKTKDGLFYIPTLGFRSALLSGTKQQRCGKVSAMSIAMAAVFTSKPETIVVNPANGKALTTYKVVSDRAVNPTKGAIIIHRPEFDPWGAIVEFKVDIELIASLEVLDKWFNRGGAIAGVGAFRIANGGEHGRFSAERI